MSVADVVLAAVEETPPADADSALVVAADSVQTVPVDLNGPQPGIPVAVHAAAVPAAPLAADVHLAVHVVVDASDFLQVVEK